MLSFTSRAFSIRNSFSSGLTLSGIAGSRINGMFEGACALVSRTASCRTASILDELERNHSASVRVAASGLTSRTVFHTSSISRDSSARARRRASISRFVPFEDTMAACALSALADDEVSPAALPSAGARESDTTCPNANEPRVPNVIKAAATRETVGGIRNREAPR